MMQETIKIGSAEYVMETGRIARQADGSVVVKAGESVILVTAVSSRKDVKEGMNFFPLTVEYREKAAAAGKIPGGYIKREGRASDHEVLTCRIIDRSIRPLFPEDYLQDTQVIATVLSSDAEVDPDICALNGAAAALHLSDIPWAGPVIGMRVIKTPDEELIVNPARSQREGALIDIVISVGPDGMIMVEGEADEVSEEDFADVLQAAEEAAAPAIKRLDEWRGKASCEKREWTRARWDEELEKRVKEFAESRLREAVTEPVKKERYLALDNLFKEIVEHLLTEEGDAGDEKKISDIFSKMKHDMIRKMITDEGTRIDGRNAETVRPIETEVGWLPGAHGSAVFTRGETQALVSCTLGATRDEQREDTLFGEEGHRFYLHYNFPPYSVGEVRPLRGAGRREIGHGNLATRAVEKLMPGEDDFPYTVRIVSDIAESNGSSSMATVCGCSLAAMDAGVPIKKPAAGVAMGLIREGEKTVILTDILGDEDHLGDMDFKVCGTADGITAVQMDNKIGALPAEILKKALEQAREARLHILAEMAKTISKPRESLSSHAPRVAQVRIRESRIGSLIGPGGKTIQEIQAVTETDIEVTDEGVVRIYAKNESDMEEAKKRVRYLTAEPEVGKIYRGTVKSVKNFGAFVEIFADYEGLVHISELKHERVERVTDVVTEGDEIVVKVLGVDRQGKISLSRKDAMNADPSDIEN